MAKRRRPKKPEEPIPFANLHHFDAKLGAAHKDEEGDVRNGWYWELIDGTGQLVGPFATKDEAVIDCLREVGLKPVP